MTPTNSSDIIERIRKCLHLAANALTEGEAAAANARAQDMLARYNLELHQIQTSAPQGKTLTNEDGTPVAEAPKRTRHTHKRSALFAYQRKMWEAVAKANFCWYVAIPEYKINTLGHRMIANYRHQFIGTEVNCLAAQLMGDYLEETLTRLCPYKMGKDVTVFKEGAADRLEIRLSQKRYEMERETQEKADAQNAATGTTTAVALRQVFTNEDDENYRFVHGEQAYQNRLWWRHDHDTCYCQRCIDYRAAQEERKRSLATVEAEDDAFIEKAETDSQRRRREEREQRASDRYWEQQNRKQRKADAKRDSEAYRAGHSAAGAIGIDSQIKGRK